MNPYSEDQLIEQPTIALLKEIGWETLKNQRRGFKPRLYSSKFSDH